MVLDIHRPELRALRRLIEEARALQDVERRGCGSRRYQAGLWEELVSSAWWPSRATGGPRTSRRCSTWTTDAPRRPPRPGSTAKLRPYQLEGYQWLSLLWDAGLGGVLADDMGLGKTLQTLALVCGPTRPGSWRRCSWWRPTSVVSNWVREAAGSRRTSRGRRRPARKRAVPLAEAAAGADVVVTSYTLLRLDEDDYRRRRGAGWCSTRPSS